MRCSKHPNYKGYKKTKRACAECDKVYQYMQKKLGKYRRYSSLTTKDLKCDIVHLLSEMSCLMLFGPLPPYFWRKGSNVPQKVKKHFGKTFKNLLVWRKNKPDMFDALKIILNVVYIRYVKRDLHQEGEVEIIEETKETIDSSKIDDSFIPNVERQKENKRLAYEALKRSANDGKKTEQ